MHSKPIKPKKKSKIEQAAQQRYLLPRQRILRQYSKPHNVCRLVRYNASNAICMCDLLASRVRGDKPAREAARACQPKEYSVNARGQCTRLTYRVDIIANIMGQYTGPIYGSINDLVNVSVLMGVLVNRRLRRLEWGKGVQKKTTTRHLLG